MVFMDILLYWFCFLSVSYSLKYVWEGNVWSQQLYLQALKKYFMGSSMIFWKMHLVVWDLWFVLHWLPASFLMTMYSVLFLYMATDGDCSQEIKRHLLLGRKVMTNLDSIFKSREIALPTKVRLVKASCMDVKVGPWRKLNAEELMLLNCGVEEDSWESPGQQGDPTSPS